MILLLKLINNVISCCCNPARLQRNDDGFILSRILSCDLSVDNICNANYVPYGYEQLRSVKYGGNFIAAQASAPVFVGASVAAKS